MTTLDERPVSTYLRNVDTKADALALALWRRRLGLTDIAHLPGSSRQRSAPTLSKFARMALRESPRVEDHDREPPHDRSSDSWKAVPRKLRELAERDDPPPRDLEHDRGRWLPIPRGWAELAALPPLDHGWCIHHPDRRPVVVTRDGGRCGDCPPRRDEWFPTIGMKRDGWGRSLDWTPRSDRSCAPGRCWCGRCPPRAASS